jgi:bacteriocin-like protein
MRDDERLEDISITLSEKALSTISGGIRRDVEIRV